MNLLLRIKQLILKTLSQIISFFSLNKLQFNYKFPFLKAINTITAGPDNKIAEAANN
jgi:hypothetical protein